MVRGRWRAGARKTRTHFTGNIFATLLDKNSLKTLHIHIFNTISGKFLPSIASHGRSRLLVFAGGAEGQCGHLGRATLAAVNLTVRLAG